MYKTSITTAKYMAARFMEVIEDYGRTQIWDQRCKTTVEWEKSIGITAVSKRAGRRNGSEDHQGSHGDFLDLNNPLRLKTDLKEAYGVTDETVLAYEMNKTKLNVIERLGSLKKVLVMDSAS
ncbi:hypothetical protein BGW38_001212 [Lunasporangiospora selenospora]|uniref:Uncharacterized protein n=1 Tax=Lunasporangiospora selenospora TaxID=979761 RepID=A0A9P6FTS2_9FUNG|nr:hypothetical protein BGW38_001212 [Lunasporangiospora selenospora]